MTKTKKDTAKKDTKKAAKKKPTPPKIEKPEYGVDQLATELDVTATVARQKLRSSGMTKEGRAWDFKSASNLKKVAKALAGDKKKPKK